MQQHQIIVPKTSNVYVLGDLDKCKEVWLVLHGYGELAKFFIQKFKCLTENNIAVIAPEGLSKFYTNGTSGRVGASWMTKENRETEINDYINYLDIVYSKFNLLTKKVTLLGFSQGGSTAVRWYKKNQTNFKSLCIWASTLPESKMLIDAKFKYVIGDKDEYISTNYIDELQNNYINIELIKFSGKHNIDLDTLKLIIKKGA